MNQIGTKKRDWISKGSGFKINHSVTVSSEDEAIRKRHAESENERLWL